MIFSLFILTYRWSDARKTLLFPVAVAAYSRWCSQAVEVLMWRWSWVVVRTWQCSGKQVRLIWFIVLYFIFAMPYLHCCYEFFSFAYSNASISTEVWDAWGEWVFVGGVIYDVVLFILHSIRLMLKKFFISFSADVVKMTMLPKGWTQIVCNKIMGCLAWVLMQVWDAWGELLLVL